MKVDEGVVRVRKMSANAKLPTRRTTRAAGYYLAVTKSAVVLVHGKYLVKTSLAMALPPDYYGRIALQSGLALKKFIDLGTGVIDSDYRGEIGVILFNFGEEDFIVNMGDKIAQLIFEKIKTPTIKETDELGGTRRGDTGYGNTGMNSTQTKNTQNFEMSNTAQSISTNKKEKIKSMNESVKKSPNCPKRGR